MDSTPFHHLSIDTAKIGDLQSRLSTDFNGALITASIYAADKLGVFCILSEQGPLSANDLAEKANISPRYALELLKALCAASYIESKVESADGRAGAGGQGGDSKERDDSSCRYRAWNAAQAGKDMDDVNVFLRDATVTDARLAIDQESQRKYFMTPEQKAVLADNEGKYALIGYAPFIIGSILKVEDVLELGFRQGTGVRFADFHKDVPVGIARMHHRYFRHFLVEKWLSAYEGVIDALECGVQVLDVGCGDGHSTFEMASVFPKSEFVGVDPSYRDSGRFCRPNLNYFAQSCEEFFELECKQQYRFDLILAFDVIHDVRNPLGFLKTLRSMLKDSLDANLFAASTDTTENGHKLDKPKLLWSEPAGFINPEQNKTMTNRARFSISILHCMTASLAEGGDGLGILIGVEGAKLLAENAGFSIEMVKTDFPSQYFYSLTKC